MLDIALTPVTDLAGLAPRWQAMHARAGGSFFQSWSWVGCLGAERFGRAVLLEAREAGRVVALGLFNRSPAGWRSRAYLGESGDPGLDQVFVEHNGCLVDHPDRPAVLAACLRACLRAGIGPLVLSGVDDAHAAAARAAGAVRVRMVRAAPCLDLATARGAGGALACFSANTRHQLRRSRRAYAAGGEPRIVRAATVAEAQDWLDAMAVLHQATWHARGKPGAFADPAFRRFHRALIARGHDSGQVDLLQARAGDAVIGYLHNFVERGRVCAYQSGFDYPAAIPHQEPGHQEPGHQEPGHQKPGHQKPGLTCHHLAIEMYAAAGLACYDFLAGADRYKTSLASGSQTLHWLALASPWSPAGMAFRARAVARDMARAVTRDMARAVTRDMARATARFDG